MNLKASTRVLLVLLQLAIGWHFFYEGAWKFQNPNWSSKGYLKNAAGPLALPMRFSAGDPDVAWANGTFSEKDTSGDIVLLLTPLAADPNDTSTEAKLHQRMPELVKEQWQKYFDAFVKNYKLDKDENQVQRQQFEADFTILKNAFVEWLLEGTKKVKQPNFAGPAGEPALPIPLRVKQYQAKLEEIKALQVQENGTFHVENTPKVKKAREEAAAIRAELTGELDNRYDLMKKALRDKLTYEQRRMPDVPEPKEEAKGWDMLPWIDGTVKWGLLIIGACLLVGLFSRTACLGGALLLLTFYVSNPPFPGVPDSPMSEGHYLFVNKNLIEMLALLALATTQPGERYGLDVWLRGLWRAMFPAKKTNAAVGPVPPLPSQTPRTPPVPPALPTYTPTKRS